MSKSQALFKRAEHVMPGGVNSPVRNFAAVDGAPIFFKSAKDAYLIDVEDQTYLDYVCCWGANLLGHAHPDILQLVSEQIQAGLGYGAPTPIEVDMAELVVSRIASIEKIRMVNSGTEATMSALRLARGITGRDKIIKFEGCYHGHADALLVKAGSGALTFGTPSSPGIPSDFTKHTLVADYNHLDSVQALFEAHPDDIAAIIVEPIAGNMNMVKATPEFLHGLRELCDQYKSILIFDEVMTGFRVAKGGAEQLYGIKPDLCCLGKVIGGGLPVGAFGGPTNVMDALSPQGGVYQAGTLSGNPVAMCAGYAALNYIKQHEDIFDTLDKYTHQLTEGLDTIAKQYRVPLTTVQQGGMFGLLFTRETDVDDYEKVMTCQPDIFKAFFKGMLAEGIYLAPSPFEVGFVTVKHNEETLQRTLIAADKVLSQMGSN